MLSSHTSISGLVVQVSERCQCIDCTTVHCSISRDQGLNPLSTSFMFDGSTAAPPRPIYPVFMSALEE